MRAPPRRALITGITGQDGSFLAELLLERGYEVTGLVRGGPNAGLGLVEHLRDRIALVPGDLLRAWSLTRAIEETGADEIYHLAAPTFVPESWRDPRATIEAIAASTATVLQAVIASRAPTRVFLASSGEMFGDAGSAPQREDTVCRPRNPYAAAKLLAHQLAGQLRDHAGVHVCCGILYNHESERRPERFVSRKITRAAAEISLGLRAELSLGDVCAVRDWSFAGDVMLGAWLSLQHETPGDYIFASGIGHTVKDLLDLAFAHLGLDPRRYVHTDPALGRRPEHTPPIGDPSRARQRLGWTATHTFEQLVARMVDADLRALREVGEGKRGHERGPPGHRETTGRCTSLAGMPSVVEALRHSPLHDRHLAAGAKLIPFAGWEMPVQYAGIKAEHLAVRRHVGVFDVSHMGEIETRGPQATELLQHLLTNDVRRIPEGGAQYSLLCRDDGGVLDDLITYRLAGQRYLTVTNAANHAGDLKWFTAKARDFDADVTDRRDDFAMLAVQGPAARTLLAGLADGHLPARMHFCQRTLAGVPMLVCATGYTGEGGAELLMDPADAPTVWDALVAAGATPCGLGARDTLRLEVCFPLYGNDLSVDRGPIEAGLGWCCAEATRFIGSAAVAAVRAAGPRQKLVAFTIAGSGIPRQGNPVAGGGVVTSGSFSPSLQRGIGMAYVAPEQAEAGTRLEIDVRGTPRTAIVEPKPIYHKDA